MTDAQLAREMALLEASLAALQSSVSTMASETRAAARAADDAKADCARLDDARRKVSAATLGVCRLSADVTPPRSRPAPLSDAALDEFAAALRLSEACWRDDFLGAETATHVRREILALDATRSFAAGRVAGGRAGSGTRFVEPAVRADRCAFVRPETPALRRLVEACDGVAAALASRGVACVPKDDLRHRGNPQLAIYEAGSEGYARHIDNSNANGRRLTAIYYANHVRGGGDASGESVEGGQLRLDDRDVLEPMLDRLVLFPAAVTPHEVLPVVAGRRVAVTIWYCDYDEHLAAQSAAAPDGDESVSLASLAARRRRAREGVG